jgi:hypothetical protein
VSSYYEPSLEQQSAKRIPMQASMAGEDWLSDNDKKRTARAIAARKKEGLACAKKLEAAAAALQAYLRACNECNDGSGDGERGYGDGRRIMIQNLLEYATYLDRKYDK